MDEEKKAKFVDGYSELTIAKLNKSGDQNKEVKLILRLKNSFTADDLLTLEKSGLKISTNAKNYVLGTAKVMNVNKIATLEFVKNLELSQRAKLH